MRKLRKMDVVFVENMAMIAIVSEVLPDGRIRLLAPESRWSGGPNGGEDDTDIEDPNDSYGSDHPNLECDLYEPEELEFIDTLHDLVNPIDKLADGW